MYNLAYPYPQFTTHLDLVYITFQGECVKEYEIELDGYYVDISFETKQGINFYC